MGNDHFLARGVAIGQRREGDGLPVVPSAGGAAGEGERAGDGHARVIGRGRRDGDARARVGVQLDAVGAGGAAFGQGHCGGGQIDRRLRAGVDNIEAAAAGGAGAAVDVGEAQGAEADGDGVVDLVRVEQRRDAHGGALAAAAEGQHAGGGVERGAGGGGHGQAQLGADGAAGEFDRHGDLFAVNERAVDRDGQLVSGRADQLGEIAGSDGERDG